MNETCWYWPLLLCVWYYLRLYRYQDVCVSLSCYNSQAERVRKLSGMSFIRALIPCMKAPPLWPNHFLKAPPPNTFILGIIISSYKCGRIQTFSLWHKMIKIQSTLKELVLVWILRRNITNKIWIYPSIDLYTYMLHKYIQKSLCLYMWRERGEESIRNWLLWLWRQRSQRSAVGKLKTREIQWYVSQFKDTQRERVLSYSAFHSTQAFNRLGKAHVHWGRSSTLFHLPSSNTPRNNVYLDICAPYGPVKLMHKINIYRAFSVTWETDTWITNYNWMRKVQ